MLKCQITKKTEAELTIAELTVLLVPPPQPVDKEAKIRDMHVNPRSPHSIHSYAAM